MGIDADGNPLQPSTKGQRPIFEIELLFEENALCFSPSEDEYIDSIVTMMTESIDAVAPTERLVKNEALESFTEL